MDHFLAVASSAITVSTGVGAGSSGNTRRGDNLQFFRLILQRKSITFGGKNGLLVCLRAGFCGTTASRLVPGLPACPLPKERRLISTSCSPQTEEVRVTAKVALSSGPAFSWARAGLLASGNPKAK